MKISCPQCSQHFEVEESWVGREMDCTSCRGRFVITPPPAEVTPGPTWVSVASTPNWSTPSPELASARRTSGLAIASLALSLGTLLLGPVGSISGIVCGHLARRQIRQDPALKGGGLAWVGLILGWTLTAGMAVAMLFFLGPLMTFFEGLKASPKTSEGPSPSEQIVETLVPPASPLPAPGAGWKWDLGSVDVPQTPVSGFLAGEAVVFGEGRIEGDDLILQAGSAELRISISSTLPGTGQSESLSTMARNGGPKFRAHTWIHTQVSSQGSGSSLTVQAKDAKGRALLAPWSLRLFITEIRNGRYPVEIYISWKDSTRSWLAGRVEATVPPELIPAAEAARDARDPLKRSRKSTRP